VKAQSVATSTTVRVIPVIVNCPRCSIPLRRSAVACLRIPCSVRVPAAVVQSTWTNFGSGPMIGAPFSTAAET